MLKRHQTNELSATRQVAPHAKITAQVASYGLPDTNMQLVIGNKNYSSWSLRPWLVLTHFGIAFEEVKLRLDSPEFFVAIEKVSPAQRVPVLVEDDGFAVWDTLAIIEYLAEQYPQHAIWPGPIRERARARSLCAEMHAGFSNLRNQMGMNIEAHLPGRGWNRSVQKDIDRITQAWTSALAESGGPFLFGDFSAADAYFAPVCFRFKTYEVSVPAAVQAYMNAVFAVPAVQQWVAVALTEHDYLAHDEPYRQTR
jgi:glutathione S-transferase